ncbi:MAG: hypothetical protein RI894_4 [Bacteroidota bacterium]|jgi:hypothetical protein
MPKAAKPLYNSNDNRMETTDSPVIVQTAALIDRMDSAIQFHLSFDSPDVSAIAQYQNARLRLIKELLHLLHLDANTVQALLAA